LNQAIAGAGLYDASPHANIGQKMNGKRMRPMAKPAPLPKRLAMSNEMTV